MSDILEMPADWWPEKILVTGTDGDVELAFAVISEEGRSTIPQSLEGLRRAIWQAKHDEKR